MHISAGSIPASPVPGRSCTIPESPTTTGSCALFIARKLMRIRPGTATPGRRPARPTGPPPGPPGGCSRPLRHLRSPSTRPAPHRRA